MTKRLSCNKSIKLLHDLTDLSYKECRTRLKKHSWELDKALFGIYGVKFETLDKALKACSNFLDEFYKALQEAFIPLIKTFTQSVADIIEQVKIEPFTDGLTPDYFKPQIIEPVNTNAIVKIEEVINNDDNRG